MRHDVIRMTMVAVAVLLLISACGGKYDDIEAVNNAFADAAETYVKDMEKADNAAKVADAVNDFAAMLEKISPKMKALSEKYPELKDPEKIPEKLKESQARTEAVSMKMAGQMMKAVTYMGDAEVQASQMRMQKALVGLGQ